MSTPVTNPVAENIQFLSLDQFKKSIGAESAQVLRNTKTGKLFLSVSTGDTYKVQQTIDPKQEMKILVSDGNLSDACLVNVSNSAEVMFSL